MVRLPFMLAAFQMLYALAIAAADSATGSSSVTPVQKVLQMIEGMKTKALKEKDAEIVDFKTFMQFCKDTSAAKEKAIADGADKIEKLAADIMKADSDAATLGKEIANLDGLADEATKDKAASTVEFERDSADYQKLHADYEANVQDIGVAISQLQTMMKAENAASAAAAASLIQKLSAKTSLPAHARHALTAFLATSSATILEESAPEGAKYESQSGGIVELMEGLKVKLVGELDALEKKFMKTKGAYMVVQQTLTDQADQHTTLRNLKAATKKEKETASATAAGDKADTEAAKAQNEAFLENLYSECAIESSEYESNQKLRAGEVTALNKALEILQGSAVAGAADKHLPSLAQIASVRKAGALAQLRSNMDVRKPSQSAAASFLQAQGKRMSSRVLTALSLRVAEDPFAKVKKMIQDMVDKLMEEANEEAEHKGFCDTEMGTNKMTREQKTTSVEELTASIEEATATISKLGEEIAGLSEQIAETNAAVAKASAIRAEEKSKNAVTVSDATAASVAVKQALSVLKAFYEGAASLVQQKTANHAKQPVQSSASTGVVGMLEVILSDFERLSADTKQAEATNQKEFERFMSDSDQSKAVLQTSVKNKSELKTETDVNLARSKKDLASTQAELDAANAYFEKLKPSCVEATVSYEDRVARREEEIESLKESLNILDDSGLAF